MLKLMIVDDEIVIREGLKNTFNWNELGYEIVAEAENGVDAIDLFYETLPDVIITDIYMQKGDGLEFIKSLKKANSKVEIIVLSGYPNFEYAQTALNNGVFAYLLKPVSMSDMIDTLKSVKEKILSNNNVNSEKFLFNLLQLSSPDINNIKKLTDKYKIQIPSSTYFIVTAEIESTDNNSNTYDQLLSEFTDKLSDKCALFVCQPRHYHIAMLIFFQGNSVKNLLYITLNTIKEELSYIFDTPISIGISNVFENLYDVRNAYMQSLFCLSQKALYGIGSMIAYEKNILNDSQSNHEEQLTTILTPTATELNNILSGVNTFNIQLLNNALNSYFERIRKFRCVNISALKNTISEIALQIIYTAAPDSKTRNLIFGNISPISQIASLGTISEIENYVFKITDLLFQHHTSLLSNNNTSLVRDAKIYIMTNYPLPISIETIADELHVTRHHLMRLFKTETGETINEFLTNYRINIASALLKVGELTISEIAQQVGYQDASYFSKIFKKITGTAPSKHISKE